MTGGPYYPAPPPPPGPGANEHLPEWLRGEGEAADVVLSSRVRLARNLAGVLFASKATPSDRQRSMELCRDQIASAGLAERLAWEPLAKAPPQNRALLVERHLISKQLSRGKSAAGGADDPRGVAFSIPDERLAIMVNEEDHLRIQTIRSGLALATAWADADAIDDKLEAGLEYAFSPRFGYLTACPTNVGTGLRMSAMLHLPALRLTGDIEKVKRAASDMNLAVRGFYGEGSEAVGDLYQLSNQTTFGKSEAEILSLLEAEILPRVIEYERIARRELLAKRRIPLEDHVWRARGILSNARLLTTEEAMQALSLVRLGVLTGVTPAPDPAAEVRLVHLLWLYVQPAHLQRAFGREMDQEQRRAARAALVRSRLGRA
ncbi:MAG: protein-arginine kinase [Phycisphaerae bacterium]|nr:MAG: protein-arginine kinase [Phycisphaerae bacterium]